MTILAHIPEAGQLAPFTPQQLIVFVLAALAITGLVALGGLTWVAGQSIKERWSS